MTLFYQGLYQPQHQTFEEYFSGALDVLPVPRSNPLAISMAEAEAAAVAKFAECYVTERMPRSNEGFTFYLTTEIGRCVATCVKRGDWVVSYKWQ
jgi:hypothetical protein